MDKKSVALFASLVALGLSSPGCQAQSQGWESPANNGGNLRPNPALRGPLTNPGPGNGGGYNPADLPGSGGGYSPSDGPGNGGGYVQTPASGSGYQMPAKQAKGRKPKSGGDAVSAAVGLPDRAAKTGLGLTDRAAKANLGLVDRSTKATLGMTDRATKTAVGLPFKAVKEVFKAAF